MFNKIKKMTNSHNFDWGIFEFYPLGDGEYEAKSEATLKMVRFVCDYQGQMD